MWRFDAQRRPTIRNSLLFGSVTRRRCILVPVDSIAMDVMPHVEVF